MKYDQWKINMDFILCVIVFVRSKPLIQEMEKSSLQCTSENSKCVKGAFN